MLLLNLSGHPVSKEITDHGYEVTEPSDPLQFDVSSASHLAGEVERLMGIFIEGLNPAQKQALLVGKYVILPPGLAPAAIVTVAYLHGVTGHFPRILWMVRGQDQEFHPIENPLPVQAVRDAARARRFI